MESLLKIGDKSEKNPELLSVAVSMAKNKA
jgi:hypothetical protein